MDFVRDSRMMVTAIVIGMLFALLVTMVPTGTPVYDIDLNMGYEPGLMEQVGMSAAGAGMSCSNDRHTHLRSGPNIIHFVYKKTDVGQTQIKKQWRQKYEGDPDFTYYGSNIC